MTFRLLFSAVILLIQPAHSQWGDCNTEKILSHIDTVILADFQSSHSEDGFAKGTFKIKEILKGRRLKAGEVVTVNDTCDLVTGPVVKFKELTKGLHLILIYHHGVSKDGKNTIDQNTIRAHLKKKFGYDPLSKLQGSQDVTMFRKD